MASVFRERLDEMFGYSGEEAKRLVESLKFCLKEDMRMPEDCDLLSIEPNSSSGANYFLYVNGCAEYDEEREHMTIKIGWQPENRRRAKITLYQMAGVSVKEE